MRIMSEDITQERSHDALVQGSSEGRNLIVVFIGFLLIGAALGLLFFGGDLFDKATAQNNGDTDTGETILDRAGALPALETGLTPGAGGSAGGGILSEGDIAYDFALQDFDGNLVRLSDFRGQPVIVNFWATWCAPCRVEMPELQAAHEKYGDGGLVILALDQDEPLDRARKFFYDEMGLSFTPLIDEGSAIATSYGSYSVLPTTFFVDQDGSVSGIHRGPLTLGQIEGYLDGMTANTS
jgi:peroxiredoxin